MSGPEERLRERGESVIAALVLAGITGSVLMALQYFSQPAPLGLSQVAAVELTAPTAAGESAAMSPGPSSGFPETKPSPEPSATTNQNEAEKNKAVESKCEPGDVHTIREVTVERKAIDNATGKEVKVPVQLPANVITHCYTEVKNPDGTVAKNSDGSTKMAPIRAAFKDFPNICALARQDRCVVRWCPIDAINPNNKCVVVKCEKGNEKCLREKLGSALSDNSIIQKYLDLQTPTTGQDPAQIQSSNGDLIDASKKEAAFNPDTWKVTSQLQSIQQKEAQLKDVNYQLELCNSWASWARIGCTSSNIQDLYTQQAKLNTEITAEQAAFEKNIETLSKMEQGSITPGGVSGGAATSPGVGSEVGGGNNDTTGSVPGKYTGPYTGPSGASVIPSDPAQQKQLEATGYTCAPNMNNNNAMTCYKPSSISQSPYPQGPCADGSSVDINGNCPGTSQCDPGLVPSRYGCRQPCEINNSCPPGQQQQPRTQGECEAQGRVWTQFGCAITQAPPGGLSPYGAHAVPGGYPTGPAGYGSGGFVEQATRSGLFYQMGYMLGSLFRNDNNAGANSVSPQTANIACAKNEEQYQDQVRQYNEMAQQFNQRLQQMQYQCQQNPYGYGGYPNGGYGSPYGYGGGSGFSYSSAPVGYSSGIGSGGCGGSGWSQLQPPPRPPAPCYDNANPSQCKASPQRPQGQCNGTWKPLTASQNGCITGWQCVPHPGSNTGASSTSTSGAGSGASTGSGSGGSGTSGNTAVSGEVAAQISCQPKVIDPGMTLAISFGCLNASSSSGEGFDTGGKLSGSVTKVAAAPPQGSNKAQYAVTCSGATGVAKAQCEVQVSKAAILLVADPNTVSSGETSVIGWITSGMDACTISSPDLPEFTAQNASLTNVNGVARTPALTKTANFILRCTSVSGGASEQSVKVTVR